MWSRVETRDQRSWQATKEKEKNKICSKSNTCTFPVFVGQGMGCWASYGLFGCYLHSFSPEIGALLYCSLCYVHRLGMTFFGLGKLAIAWGNHWVLSSLFHFLLALP